MWPCDSLYDSLNDSLVTAYLPVPGLGGGPVVEEVANAVQLTRPRRADQGRLPPGQKSYD